MSKLTGELQYEGKTTTFFENSFLNNMLATGWLVTDLNNFNLLGLNHTAERVNLQLIDCVNWVFFDFLDTYIYAILKAVFLGWFGLVSNFSVYFLT